MRIPGRGADSIGTPCTLCLNDVTSRVKSEKRESEREKEKGGGGGENNDELE